MRTAILLSALSWLATVPCSAEPFVEYPDAVGAYLQRTQAGRQTHSFNAAKDFAQWQTEARTALVELSGLKRMAEDLKDFKPTVTVGEGELVDGAFIRKLCSIQTEPGISVPFYLLLPIAEKGERRPLLLCPHGHDNRGLHSYAGAFKDDAHRKTILGRGGNIAEQAARRGFVAIAPATRGLAAEVLVPDPKGRHGGRPCRAQFMHCLVAGRTPQAERMWDMQRLLDWALTHSRVDPKRVVMTGNSGGGVLTAWTAAIDQRIRVAIPSCSFTALTSREGFLFHCDCCLVPGMRDWGDWPELGGLVAPRHLLIVHGVEDGLHDRKTVERASAAVARIFGSAGVPGHTAIRWGEGGHRFYPELMWPFIDKALAE